VTNSRSLRFGTGLLGQIGRSALLTANVNRPRTRLEDHRTSVDWSTADGRAASVAFSNGDYLVCDLGIWDQSVSDPL
jgi:hypothetical protein